ncbi:hypothetical protein HB370_06445 [Streptomyces sp. DSM 40868]|nr:MULTISPECIES: hypothetical protein [Streptomyces]QIS69670.1 hypothetical protein HB370_06445 [Streptomyces sp. DSM 40868]
MKTGPGTLLSASSPPTEPSCEAPNSSVVHDSRSPTPIKPSHSHGEPARARPEQSVGTDPAADADVFTTETTEEVEAEGLLGVGGQPVEELLGEAAPGRPRVDVGEGVEPGFLPQVLPAHPLVDLLLGVLETRGLAPQQVRFSGGGERVVHQ